MAALDQFNALPMKQKVGIIAGAGGVIALVFVYLIYDNLGKLGPDKENLFSFMTRDTGTGIWNEINTINQKIDELQKKAATLGEKEKELAALNKEIEIAREYLPKERQKSQIYEELGVFAKDVVTENLGNINMTRLDISEVVKRQSSSRRKKKGGEQEAQSITFTCDFETDIDGLIAFVNKVERSTRFMTVDGIEINPGDVKADLDDPTDPKEARTLHKAKVIINTWVLPEGDK